MDIEKLKKRCGYDGKPQQWQYGFDLACRELAKTQAIPDGFVVVPKEPNKQFKNVLSRYLDELWMGEWGCDWDGFICVNGIDPNHVWKIVTATKAMIEAEQEPANES